MPTKKEQTAESKAIQPKKKTTRAASTSALPGAELTQTEGTKASVRKPSSPKAPSKASEKKPSPKAAQKKPKLSHETIPGSTVSLVQPHGNGAEPPQTAGQHPELAHAAEHDLNHLGVVTNEMIAVRAYFLAENRQASGHPGDHAADWHEAERQLRAEVASIAASLGHRS